MENEISCKVHVHRVTSIVTAQLLHFISPDIDMYIKSNMFAEINRRAIWLFHLHLSVC